MIGSNDPAGAGHVFNHGRRTARNMLGKMAGNHPGIKIKRTSCRVADDETNSLVFEEILRVQHRRAVRLFSFPFGPATLLLLRPASFLICAFSSSSRFSLA